MNSFLFQLEERIRNSSHSCGTDNNIHLSFWLGAVLTFLPSVIIYSEEIWTAWKSHRTSHQYIILMASCWLFRTSKRWLVCWRVSLVAQRVKNPPVMRETWVQSLDGEDPLEEGMATHSSILAWRIPRTEESGRLQFRGLQSWTQLSN